jgi:hypothetical protein
MSIAITISKTASGNGGASAVACAAIPPCRTSRDSAARLISMQ